MSVTTIDKYPVLVMRSWSINTWHLVVGVVVVIASRFITAELPRLTLNYIYISVSVC
jgi:hypothetical protein